MILILLFNFFNVLNHLRARDKRLKEGRTESPEEILQGFVTLALGLLLLFASFCYIIFLPLIQISFRQWTQPPLPAEWAEHQSGRKRVPKLVEKIPEPPPVIEAPAEDFSAGPQKSFSWRRRPEPPIEAPPALMGLSELDLPGAIGDLSMSMTY